MTTRFATWADKAEVERICSHPEVRKWTHRTSAPFDAGKWLQGRNMVVLGDGACFISPHLGGTHYGIHTNVLPEARGPKRTLTFATEALMLGFLGSDAETFLTQVPTSNYAAQWLVEQMGFRYTNTREKAWGDEALHYWRLDIDDWILRGHLHPLGAGFHEVLEHQGLGPSHDPDPTHDCYVGALVALIGSGRAAKGLRIYNRWANLAGYTQLQQLSQQPLVVDAKEFLVVVENGEMKLKRKEGEYAH